MTRVCSKCGRELPATTEFFNRNGQYLYSQCRECKQAYTSAWGKANRDRIRERRQERHAANPDVRKQRARAYYESHRDAIAASSTAYRKAHPEVSRRSTANYRKRHPDRIEQYKSDRAVQIAEYKRRWLCENRSLARDYKRARRARERASGDGFTSADVRAQYNRQRGKCYWCQSPVADGYHVDHVVPLARGGSNSPDNIVVACPSCNRRKHAKLPHEFCDRLC